MRKAWFFVKAQQWLNQLLKKSPFPEYFLFPLYIVFEMESPGWSAVAHFSAHCNLCLPDSSDSPAWASWVARITGISHHTWLIFVFLVETGFTMLARLVSNSWPQIIPCVGLPKCWDHRGEPLYPAYNWLFLNGQRIEAELTGFTNNLLEIIVVKLRTNSFLFFWDRVSLCCPGWSAVAWSQLTATSASRVQVILLPQPP